MTLVSKAPTVVSLSAINGGTIAVNVPDNVKVQDDNPSNATAFGGGIPPATIAIKCQGFGFKLPKTAKINSITVKVRKRATGSTATRYATDYWIRLEKSNATLAPDNKADTITAYPLAFVDSTYGGDLWGTTWTADDVNGDNFVAYVSQTLTAPSAVTITALVDYIEVTIDYTAPKIKKIGGKALAAINEILGITIASAYTVGGVLTA